MTSKCVKQKSKKFISHSIDFLFDTSKLALVNIFLSPLFSMLGRQTNILNVFILSRKNHIQNNNFFCSQFYRSVLAQLYDIYFVEFLASILKTMSNFLMVIISPDRYFLLKG
ncbi:hypothetical protein BpHYR1_042877 [Brachionus plicatilis]|uniref:Uncharacterized protein n=1 Tax=Brachionus plicatilis TaxID=10195 RepID=A0A3M7QRA6_BRAPC|nr:hypothetical protein BpHYR1_042877 [Brachionus plicatilis]